MDYRLEILRDEMLNIPLKVCAFDKNTLADTLIGQGVVSLKKCASNISNETEFQLTLLDSQKKNVGTIRFFCVLQLKPSALKISPGLTEGCVRIEKIVSHDLFSASPLFTPTPKILIKYGSWTSEELKGSGVNPTWDLLKIQTDVFPAKAFESQIFSVDLIENDKVVGAGKVENLLLAASQVGQVVQVPVDLFQTASKKPRSAGTIILHMSVVDRETLDKEENEKKAVIEKEKSVKKIAIKDGTLFITYLKGTELATRDLFGKGDPFAILSFGSSWVQETPALSGGSVIWEGLSFSLDVTGEELVNEKLSAVVMDKNNIQSNSLIGKADFNLERLAYSPGKEIELEADLMDSKDKRAGKLLVRLEVRERLEIVKKGKLPDGFKGGVLHIVRVRTFGLAKSGIFGGASHYIVAKLDGHADMRTPTLDHGGGDMLFDFLDLKAEVTPDVLVKGIII